MPKSKHRKNHKKKVQSWKNSQAHQRNIAMKKFEDMKEKMTEEHNKKTEEATQKETPTKTSEINPSINTLRPADIYPTKNK